MEQGSDKVTTETTKKTEVGSYFVANYPPFSAWSPDYAGAVTERLNKAPGNAAPVGLYAHIPFCRKRCKFCYFRVYTDKTKTDRDRYLDALGKEWELLGQCPVLGGRPLNFIYVGGGTPSALNEEQITIFGELLRKHWSWDDVEEFTFECEPGTLTEDKVQLIRDIGVTRVSLGIENFSDDVLKENGRAHLSPEVYKAYDWIRARDFSQVNIDLIAGMVGETEENWKDSVRRAIELSPSSVTIYQMELPFNTVYSKGVLSDGNESGVADWPTKRHWVRYAFDQLADVGYVRSSAYTMVKPGEHAGFVYRDALWHGADMIGTGVASFGYIQGVHMQNLDNFGPYVESCERGDLPIYRGYPSTMHQQLVREMILQMKLGELHASPFTEKFGVYIFDLFAEGYTALEHEGMLTRENGSVRLTDEGLLQVDGCLPRFYEPDHRSVRYT